jgi:hypothetical protein
MFNVGIQMAILKTCPVATIRIDVGNGHELLIYLYHSASTIPVPYCALGDERVKSFKQSLLPF